MIGYDGYRLGSGQAGKYRIGLNIVRTGEIGVKGLFLEYGEYSAEYSPTPSLKPLSCQNNLWGIRRVCRLLCAHMSLEDIIMCVESGLKRMFSLKTLFEIVYMTLPCEG